MLAVQKCPALLVFQHIRLNANVELVQMLAQPAKRKALVAEQERTEKSVLQKHRDKQKHVIKRSLKQMKRRGVRLLEQRQRQR
ncbi:MAG: hypothetical protein CL942_14940 [Desulfovibrio sp.]|nr:hypothetical protein [Desulfovibrio sp.]